jgi:splicing factor 3A subunit 1
MDPYYRYYDWRLTELQTGGTKQSTPFTTRTSTPQIKKETGPPEPPPYYFSGKLPPISAQDLDILRLTALFVARHGNAFQRAIAERESRNYQFDFLRANHSLYPYFQQMVSEYHRVLLPPKDMLDQVRRLAEDKEAILDDIQVRVAWQKHILEKASKDKQEQEREKCTPSSLLLESELMVVEFAQIDWHDFIVVATIEFTTADDAMELPPPTSLTDLEYATLEQKRLMVNYDPDTRRLEAMPEDNPYAPPTRQQITPVQPSAPAPAPVPEPTPQEVDMEISDGEEEDELPQPKALPATLAGGMKIRPAGYVPRTTRNIVTQVCPNCGERIPVDELDEHMRIELLDPKWKEQKAIAEKRQMATNLVGADVARNVKRLAERGREDDSNVKRQRSYMDR